MHPKKIRSVKVLNNIIFSKVKIVNFIKVLQVLLRDVRSTLGNETRPARIQTIRPVFTNKVVKYTIIWSTGPGMEPKTQDPDPCPIF